MKCDVYRLFLKSGRRLRVLGRKSKHPSATMIRASDSLSPNGTPEAEMTAEF